MTATTIGIVHATNSCMIRRVIYPDSDDQLAKQNWAGPGESLLIVDAKTIATNDDLAAAVQLATGQKPMDFNVAVVDEKGTVVSLIKADPTLDTIPGATLIAAPEGVAAGASYDEKTASFTIPETLIPATVDKTTGLPIAEKIIPAQILPAIDAVAEIQAAQETAALKSAPISPIVK